MSVNGCDLSSFQHTVDFDKLRSQVTFVISKVTEGTGYRDPTFGRNWDETTRVGLVRGAYHFAHPDLGLSAQNEAAYFLSNLGPLAEDDLLALDYEVDWDGDVVGWCKEFLDEVRLATGIAALAYLNLSVIRSHDWSPVIDAGYPLWLADYDGLPDVVPQTQWPQLAIKQWTSGGTLAGVTGRIDLNRVISYPRLEDAVTLRDEFNTFKTDTENTIAAMKKTYDKLYHHVHLPGTVQTTPPLFPPQPDVVYAGSSADFAQTFWLYSDGVVRNQDGQPKP